MVQREQLRQEIPRGVARLVSLAGFVRDASWLRRDSSASKQRAMVERLLTLHGLPQKLGQLLVSAPDSPLRELTESCSAARAPALNTFVQLLEAGLGRPAYSVFSHIEEAAHVASLSCVRRAVLRDGRRVVVKVQLPGIRASVESDLGTLGWLTLPFGGLRRGFALADYRRVVGDMLRGELDYLAEAEWLRRYAFWTRAVPDILVPEPIDEACSATVLTMSEVCGESLFVAQTWQERERHALACVLLRWFFVQLRAFNALHADPHVGNFRVTQSSRFPLLSVLDFGCVLPWPRPQALHFAALIAAAQRGETRSFVWMNHYLGLGFQEDLLAPMADRLAALSAVLFAPFVASGPFGMDDWRLAQRTASVLGEHRQSFRVAGPAELIYLMRAFQGVLRYVTMLNVKVDWAELWEQAGEWRHTDDNDNDVNVNVNVNLNVNVNVSSSDVIAPDATNIAATSPAPSAVGAPPHSIPAASAAGTRLFVVVTERGKEVVSVIMRGSVAERLSAVMPDDVVERVSGRGIDLAALSARAKASGYAAQNLFSFDEGARRYRVWLE